MPLPLEPHDGLFPDVLVPPFVRSEVLEELILSVRDTFPEFREVVEAMDQGAITIGYVFETKPFDALSEDYKPHTIAKVTKASPLWREWGEVDAIIQFRQTFWDAFNDDQRRAVAYHELRHLDPAIDDKGRWRLSLRHHELEEFSGVMRHFGPIIPGRKQFLDAAMAWVHEQEHPEPTPLRSVEAVAEEGAARLAATAMKPGSGVDSLTVTTRSPGKPPRSATLDRATADRLAARIGTGPKKRPAQR